jgi:flagellar motor switch protein FliN
MSTPGDLKLDNLAEGGLPQNVRPSRVDDSGPRGPKSATDLEQVLDVPVNVSAVLGRTRMEIGQLLKIAPGQVLELDRKIGEAIDIFVNNRLVARGEVVLVEEKLGVTMTEIIRAER